MRLVEAVLDGRPDKVVVFAVGGVLLVSLVLLAESLKFAERR